MRYQGRITRWQDDRGFGYIAPNGGGDELFVHVRALSGWRGRPAGGEIVTYGHARDARGRPCASDVRRVDLRPARMSPSRSASSGTGAWWLAGGFLAALGVAVVFGRLPPAVLAVVVGMSALTFAVNNKRGQVHLIGARSPPSPACRLNSACSTFNNASA